MARYTLAINVAETHVIIEVVPAVGETPGDEILPVLRYSPEAVESIVEDLRNAARDCRRRLDGAGAT